MKAKDFVSELQKCASDQDAAFLQRFFKTGPGEYGEGDQFIGVRVPDTRKVCGAFKDMEISEIQKLLDSPIHEHRLGGAIILANQYAKSENQRAIYELYLKNLKNNRINNWDIVDATVEGVVGAHLYQKDRKILFELARSSNIWERRASAVATFKFIKMGDASTTLEIADILLHDEHDLIQKAVGWMLREVGNRVDLSLLTSFLDKNAKNMPRTMLRYSIEKLSVDQRIKYMKKR